MPTTYTYPGVYVEEIPSGVRTITGVATSITAFVGRTRRGPTNEPRTINSFGDFERIYGGLWNESSLGYAVRDFYRNGGSQAIIVRLHAADATTAELTRSVKLMAASPGSWGNTLRVRVEHDTQLPEVASQRLTVDPSEPITPGDVFNLIVRDTKTGATETFLNLTVKDSLRRINQVLERESSLIRAEDPTAQQQIPDKHDPPVPTDPDKTRDKIWENDELSTGMSNLGIDGGDLTTPIFTGDRANKKGLYQLEKVDLFNILCIPPYTAEGNADQGVITEGATYCEERRAFLLIDPPTGWTDKDNAKEGINAGIGTRSKNAAVFFPRFMQPNPLRDDQMEERVPCGAVAGVFARTDAQRGVWKAPAGLAATLAGVPKLSVRLTDPEIGELNPLGVNCLRVAPAAGPVAWGARTLDGDDRLASEWKYIPVRRLALFIEESLYRGTQWVVFEPNDEPLWAQIRLNVGAFMRNLFRQGAFQGASPREAYFVKCDKESTTQNDINLGIVNIVVGFAPLKPAEFVILKIQQIAGEILT